MHVDGLKSFHGHVDGHLHSKCPARRENSQANSCDDIRIRLRRPDLSCGRVRKFVLAGCSGDAAPGSRFQGLSSLALNSHSCRAASNVSNVGSSHISAIKNAPGCPVKRFLVQRVVFIRQNRVTQAGDRLGAAGIDRGRARAVVNAARVLRLSLAVQIPNQSLGKIVKNPDVFSCDQEIVKGQGRLCALVLPSYDVSGDTEVLCEGRGEKLRRGRLLDNLCVTSHLRARRERSSDSDRCQ